MAVAYSDPGAYLDPAVLKNMKNKVIMQQFFSLYKVQRFDSLHENTDFRYRFYTEISSVLLCLRSYAVTNPSNVSQSSSLWEHP